MPQSSQRWFLGVNIPMFLMLFGLMLTNNVTTNLVMSRTCHVIMGYNETECAQLGTHNESKHIIELEKIVQKEASIVLLGKTLVESLVPAFIGLFLGPWSDKHGRKPLILLALIGHAITYGLYAVVAAFPEATPWFFVAASSGISLSGGIYVLLTAIFCVVSDVVPVDHRAVAMGVLQGSISIGMLLGTSASAPLFNIGGSVCIYVTCTLCLILALLYTWCLLPESVDDVHEAEGLRGLFDWKLVSIMVKTCFKKREHSNRAIIWLVLLTLAFLVFALNGSFEMDYLYVRARFHWEFDKYTIFSALRSIVQIKGTILGVYILNKIFHVSEVVLAMCALASSGSVAVVMAIAVRDWHMLLVIPIGMLGGVASPMCRTILSRAVPPNELGKVFAMGASIEALTPLMAAPIYTYIYNKTLLIYPGAFEFLTAGLYYSGFLLLGAILIIRQSSTQESTYSEMSPAPITSPEEA